jgi:hypothetical protein
MDLTHLISIFDPIIQVRKLVKQLLSFIIHIQSLLINIEECLFCRIKIFRQSVFCQSGPLAEGSIPR